MNKKIIKNILVFSNLKSHITYEDNLDVEIDEPIHPYLGRRWSEQLSKKNLNVAYLNTYNYKVRSKIQSFYYNFIVLPKKYDTVIVHSTSGIGRAFLVKLFNWKINVIYFSLSQINPRGLHLMKYFRFLLVYLDYTSSQKIYYGLNCIKDNTNLKYFKYKSVYFPFYVDIDFFQSKLNQINTINQIEPKGYILVVGDITRDDEYLYNELSTSKKPIIRISRDKTVIENVHKIYNPTRGDLVLTGVSFIDLSHYYKNSYCCIIASKEDYCPSQVELHQSLKQWHVMQFV